MRRVTVDPRKGSFRVPTTEEKNSFQEAELQAECRVGCFSIITILSITSTIKVSPQNLVGEENSEPCTITVKETSHH